MTSKQGKPEIPAEGVENSTRRKTLQFEEISIEREEFFNALVANSTDVIMIIGPGNIVEYISPSLERLLGYRPDELIGTTGFELVHPDDIEAMAEAIGQVAKTGTPGSVVFRARHRDGSWVICESMGSLLPDTRGRKRLVVNSRDITERVSLENSLASANHELEMLARTVTHDIMAPLSAISIVSESIAGLLDDDLQEEEMDILRGMIDTLRDCTADAVGLASEVLSFSQVGALPGTIEEVDIARVVNRVAAQFEPEIDSRGVDLQVGQELGVVLANPTNIYQLFANLIKNSIKYNANPHPVIQVSRLDSEAGGVHRFRVCDNGPGIEPSVIDGIFQPYSKGPRGGTGLGLSTVLRIVKLYGGDITVCNEAGACFEFTLSDVRHSL